MRTIYGLALERAHPVVGEVVPHHRDVARVGPDQTEAEPDEGRLARAVGAEEAEALAGLDDQVDPVDAGRGAVHPCQRRGLDGVVHCEGGYRRPVQIIPTRDADWGASWIAAAPASMQRASHALATDDGVWLVDPVDGDGVTDLIAPLGPVRGVVQLLDRHPRDCAALAARHGVAHLRVPFGAVAGSPFEVVAVVDRPWWREVALWWRARRALVVAESLGTAPYFLARGARIGVHPLMRLTPPRALRRLDPLHLLPGHGAPESGEHVSDAIRAALGHSRRDIPGALVSMVARRRR